MIFRDVLGPCLAVSLCAVPASLAEGPSLPSGECLHMLRKARIAAMAGDVSGELETLRAAVEAFPQEIAPVYALIDYHHRNRLPEQEHQKLQALFARRLEDPERELPVGVLAAVARDPEAEASTLRLMEEHVRRRLESGGTRGPDLLELLAQLQERLGQVEAAAGTLEELYRLQPSEILEWKLFQHYLRLERWGAAADVLASLIEKGQGEILRGPYIRLLSKAGRIEEQKRQIDLWVSSTDEFFAADIVDVLWTSAWDLRDRGHDAEAEQQLRRVLELDPEHQGARSALLHLYGTEEERQAFAAAEAERWQDEADPRTLFDEGTERLMAGDAAAAVELLKRAAPGLADLEAAWYNLGMAAYRLEDWAIAESGFGRAAELNPERAESFFFRGIALVNLDRCGDAVAPLERTLELDPKRSLAHYHLARCYRILDDADAAAHHQRLYDAARQTGPG